MRQIFTRVGRKIKTNTKLLAGLTVGLILGGGTIAFASIPDASGVIHACYSNLTGSARIIDSPSASCLVGETAINWDQSGGASKTLAPSLANKNLAGANYVGWDLDGLNFTNANLDTARLTGADVTGATFTGAYLVSAYLDGTNFSNANLQGVTLGNNVFTNANFQNANLAGATFTFFGSDSGDFQGATLTNATIGSGFYNTNFSNADFSGADFAPDANFNSAALFQNVNFSGADFTGATFTTDPLLNLQFTDSTFDGADLSGLNIVQVLWSNTVCPDGTNSDSHSNTCSGHLVP
jgi:uncharacterized protein YjbI with pentapeptide repeats